MPVPVDIDIDRQRSVTVTWEDGHVSRFGLAELRLRCQCARCRGMRQEGQTVWPAPGTPRELRVESAHQVGNWGLSIAWNDGHSTGIYAWDVLRAWCPCGQCR
ncbi:MAG: DUF971 domain-containing protein [Actinomycetota bacterium]|nr:DUF971 domain-containing protein [Actinomycetota bacterium]